MIEGSGARAVIFTERTAVRFSGTQMETVEKAARLSELHFSSFVRNAAVAQAKRMLERSGVELQAQG